MTSRREFFGLLAAAPLVAPVVVKEMAKASLVEPRSINIMSHMRVASGESFRLYGNMIKLNTPRMKDWSRCAYFDHYPFESEIAGYRSAIIPNRLYGAQINADGDAV